MFTIQVTYTTGNSFGSEEVTEEIGLVWKDIELAKNALQSIREQYFLADDNSSLNYKACDALALTFEWARQLDNIGLYSTSWRHSIAVLMDDGTYRQLSTSWIGYFERLDKAKVVPVSVDGDLSFVFNPYREKNIYE